MASERPQLQRRDIVVVGASAGGVEALKRLVAALPGDLAAAVFVVLHLHPEAPSLLPQILQGATGLDVVSAADDDEVRPGRVVVAVPDRHLVLEDGRVKALRGPKENGHRPSIDVLFRSAAAAYASRVAGVVLTGTLSDGALGLWTVRSSGGLVIVQDPAEASYPDMPRAVLETMAVDHSLGVEEIAALLAEVAGSGNGRGPRAGMGPQEDRGEVTMDETQRDDRSQEAMARRMSVPGRLSAFTCPACGGALWELEEEDVLSYRCHVGHGFSAEGLASAQSSSGEEALYSALRALKERIALARRMSEHYAERFPEMGARNAAEADELQRHADVLARMLTGGG